MTISNLPAGDRLLSFIQRVERLEEETKALNADKSEVYKEAKATGFDVKAMKRCVQLRRMDTTERVEFEDIVSVYMDALEEAGTPVATRARAQDEPPHNADTGEINETSSAEGAPARADVAPDHVVSDDAPCTLQEQGEDRDSLSENTPPAALHAGERGASNRTSQDEAPPQAGGDAPQVSTANSDASPQSANDIIPDEMPPMCNRRVEAA